MDPTHEAFDRTWKKVETDVRRLVAPRVDSSADRDDALLDVRATAWRRFPTHAPERPFLNWVLAIAHFACADHFRSRRPEEVEAVPNERADTVLDFAADPAPGALEGLIAEDLEPRLAAAIGSLKARHRTALLMRADGAKASEIGAALGTTDSNACHTVEAAALQVRRFLQRDEHETPNPPRRRADRGRGRRPRLVARS